MICLVQNDGRWSKFLPNDPSLPGNCSCPSAKVTSLAPCHHDTTHMDHGWPLATQGRPTRSYPTRGKLYEFMFCWVWDDNTKIWVEHHSKKVDGRISKTERWLCLATLHGNPKKEVNTGSISLLNAVPEHRQADKGRGAGDVSYGSPFGQSETIRSSKITGY